MLTQEIALQAEATVIDVIEHILMAQPEDIIDTLFRKKTTVNPESVKRIRAFILLQEQLAERWFKQEICEKEHQYLQVTHTLPTKVKEVLNGLSAEQWTLLEETIRTFPKIVDLKPLNAYKLELEELAVNQYIRSLSHFELDQFIYQHKKPEKRAVLEMPFIWLGSSPG